MGGSSHVKNTVMGDVVSRLRGMYGSDLLKFLSRRLGRRELAEEVAQETWLQMHRVPRLDELPYPQRLLFNIAAKLVSNHLRRAKLEQIVATGLPEMDEVPDDARRPDRRAANDQAMQRLEDIVERLPPDLKDGFVMRYFQQMSHQEIAEQLGLTVRAVEKRIHKAQAYCLRRLQALGIDWLALD
jgi:RNA polymerase sigma factor (sigma-70 family)